jgi:hypothetical protein
LESLRGVASHRDGAEMKEPGVHVIVLNRNGQAHNKDCIDSLKRSHYANLKIWLVDNASDDGSPDWVEANYADVTVVRSGGNLGWSGGNNAGIRRALAAGADYLWILNNDVEVEPDCIPNLIHMAESGGRPAIVGPRIYYYQPRDEVWFEGGEVSLKDLKSEHCSNERFRRLPMNERYISGCALMVRREVFDRIGIIDERYFIYYEDTDFCLRAAAAGFGIDVEMSAIMYHKVGSYSGGVSKQINPFHAYHILRSGMLFWRKHLGFWRFHRRWCRGHLGKWVNQIPEWMADPARRASAESMIDAVWYYVSMRRAPTKRPPAPAWFRRVMMRRPWLVANLMAFRLL